MDGIHTLEFARWIRTIESARRNPHTMKFALWNIHDSIRTMESALDRCSPVNAIPPMHSSECTPSWCAPVEALQSMHSSRGTPIYTLQSMHSSRGTAHAHRTRAPHRTRALHTDGQLIRAPHTAGNAHGQRTRGDGQRTRAQHTGSHRNSSYSIIDNCMSRGLSYFYSSKCFDSLRFSKFSYAFQS